MYVGIIFFVIFLESIQTLQTFDQDNVNKESYGSQVHNYKNESEKSSSKRVVNNNENGIALILTPLIESGNLTEAKRMSEVKSDLFLGVKSYSGFLTVNKTYNSNLFFWYFPIEDQLVSESPWIIWLQGAPGFPSLDGLFYEIGPFKLQNELPLRRNPYSWLRDHSLVFIESPVGAGYSFTDHQDGFARDLPTYALHLKLAVLQLLQVFPELKAAPLFIAGESYGGKYAPALAMELHKAKEYGSEVNLQGIITGNAFIDASLLTHMHEAFYYRGLISKEDLTSIQPSMAAFAEDIRNNKSESAKKKWDAIIDNLLINVSALTNAQSTLDVDIQLGQYHWLLDRSDVKRALHVGNIESSIMNDTVHNITLKGQLLTSVRPLYEELLNHNYRVLAYCGMLNVMLPCYLESEEYRKWNWSKSKEFINASRYLYYFNNKRAGYYKSGGHLTEVQIRKAGHFVAKDTPATIQDLVSGWTYNQPHDLLILPRNDTYNENGTALILTRLIESGKLTEAKRMSEVKSEIFLGVKSYSGFLTVNKTYNSNLFFWYFPIENQIVSESPWIIWLQGGPGFSSLDGLFYEIGPFILANDLSLQRNPYSWLQNHSLVFIDSPVGAGYSFTDHQDGFARDMPTYSLHLKLAVVQLLELFPELKVAPLFIAGDSYGGKYAPALAMELHKDKENGSDLNLQGIITGNGYVDASLLTHLHEAFYYRGLLSKEDLTTIQPSMEAFADDIRNNKTDAAKEKWGAIIDNLLINVSALMYAHSSLDVDIQFGPYHRLLDRSDVKRALHVGNIESSIMNDTVHNITLNGELLTSARPLYEELLNHNYKVLAYCGMLNVMVPCYLESEEYRKWNWNNSKEFINATRNHYYFNNTLAGYYKSGGHLTEVLIKNAGHFVAKDTPATIQDLVSEWTHYQSQDLVRLPRSKVNINENGTALILTPLIESGNLNEAKRMCEVKSDIFLGVKSYSGFLTVNKTYNSNLFFWYFPIENQIVSESPWIIWLQGTPGFSSLDGLFYEIGPFILSNNFTLKRNPYSWLQNHSLLFIDSPVGAGYSFTDHQDGFARDMPTYALHLKLAVGQLLQLFPELKKAPLFVAGESYVGKYAPALAMELHKDKEFGSIMNLQVLMTEVKGGIIIGNGFVDPSLLTHLHEAFYYRGFISREDLTTIQPSMDAFADDIRNNKSDAAKEKWGTIIYNLFINMSALEYAHSSLHVDIQFGPYHRLLDRSDVKRALHVGNIESSIMNNTVHNITVNGELLSSARPLYEELLNHNYKVLAYCGMLNVMLPCYLESEEYRKWSWIKSKEFINAPRNPYNFNKTNAGYYKSGGHLTEVEIRNAGHFVAKDVPATIQYLVSDWTHTQSNGSKPIPRRNIESSDVNNNVNETYNRRHDLVPLPTSDVNNNGNGTALILTPLIESGKLTEAKRMSEVKSDIFLGVKSYSGFLTVNKTYNSNLFFWYFPIENQLVSDSPWIIWLQDGPGFSSLDGLFYEIGPFILQKDLPLRRNPYSWLQNHSLVFIDSPVGAGYSFTDHPDGFARDLPTDTLHLKLAVLQLLQIFPELKTAPLFVAGESYGGKYAPALAMELHKAKENGSEINLQGIITGTAFFDVSLLTHIQETYQHLGLLTKEDLTTIQPAVVAFGNDIKGNERAVKEKLAAIIVNLLFMVTEKNESRSSDVDIQYGPYQWLLDRDDVKRALHVGNIESSILNDVVHTRNFTLNGELLISSRPLYEELLNHNYKVLAYCGRLDALLPCYLDSKEYRMWTWNKSKEFINATRNIYYFNNTVAGHYRSGGHLTEAKILLDGIYESIDTPAALQDLVTGWTHNHPPVLIPIPRRKSNDVNNNKNQSVSN